MILACPSCQARYLVPATHFAAGARQVKCGRCTHTWHAEAPTEPAAMAEQLSAISPAANEAATVNPAPVLPIIHEERRSFLQQGWVLAAAIMLFAGILLFMFADRREIARRWPVMEQFYDSIGLHIYHAGEGLSLRKVWSQNKFEGGVMQLEVEGEVHNDTDKPQSIPNILAAAIGPDGNTMQSWQIDAPAATVAPGDSIPFSSSIHAPKGTVVGINLNFVESSYGP